MACTASSRVEDLEEQQLGASTSRRMCCRTHCASFRAPCQPLLQAFTSRSRSLVARCRSRSRPFFTSFSSRACWVWSLEFKVLGFNVQGPPGIQTKPISHAQVSSLELSDAKVYEPYTQAFLGTYPGPTTPHHPTNRLIPKDIPRRARTSGSYTCVSLDSSLERNKNEGPGHVPKTFFIFITVEPRVE